MYDSLYHPITIGKNSSAPTGILQLEGNLFLAPVAGYSDRAFRSICANGGANFAYTEMVSAEALVRGSDKTEQLMARAINEKYYGVQIFGSDAQTMGRATTIVLQKVHPNLIDINSGCPVHKITKTGSGSALMKDPDTLYHIVKAVVDAASNHPAPIPISVKIRSGWDSGSLLWKEAAFAIKEAGAAAITIHPRTRSQGYEGHSDWQVLADLVQLMQNASDGIPVFGSGDIYSPEDASNMLTQTGCDAVMFARGAMGAPFIFKQTQDFLQKGSYDAIPFEQSIKAGLQELSILCADRGEASACREMRKRFCAYTKNVEGGANLRKSIVEAKTEDDYRKIFSSLIVKKT